MPSITDGVGYDHQPTRPPRRWPRYLAAAVLPAIVVAIIAAAGRATPPTPPTTTPAPAATTATPTHSHDEAGAPREAWVTLHDFITGWTTTDPGARRDTLDGVTAPGLADGLNHTAPENIPTGHQTAASVTDAGPYATQFTVIIDGLPDPVTVTLEADPESDHGWRVTSITN